jgi:hypothetical protein
MFTQLHKSPKTKIVFVKRDRDRKKPLKALLSQLLKGWLGENSWCDYVSADFGLAER